MMLMRHVGVILHVDNAVLLPLPHRFGRGSQQETSKAKRATSLSSVSMCCAGRKEVTGT